MPGYTLSADETAYFSDAAALLDPDAYEYVVGTSQTRTVPSGERWYLLSGWYLAAASGSSWFHRVPNALDALPLSEDTVLTTDASNAGSHMYVAKPSLVNGDSRYATDPRGLFFERLQRIAGELEQFELGTTNTGSGTTDVAFPTDFTNGIVIHVSSHDIAWLTLLDVAEAAGMNTLNEISDADPIRFAQPTLIPFKRTTFDQIRVRGASEAEGRGVLRYVKLPADW